MLVRTSQCLNVRKINYLPWHTNFTVLCVTDEIEKMPLANTPEVMGLHSNAGIGYYTQAAKDMWTHLIDLQPQTGMV